MHEDQKKTARDDLRAVKGQSDLLVFAGRAG
jgi:hypothetical protein